MENKNCFKCNSNSTVYDLGQWVCALCITLCTCSKNHNTNNDWEYSGVYPSIPITVEAMEFQMLSDTIEESDES